MAEYDVFSSEAIDEALVPCSICNRTFMPETLVKHERICAKASTSKRKVFQSGQQRAQGSDVPLKSVIKTGVTPAKSEAAKNKNNWRQKHEQLIQGLKAARGVKAALASGQPLPPPPPPVFNPDYVQCPSCSRRFNETAAERHIPFCKEKNKRIPDKKSVDPNAQRRKDARLNYKTAKPKLKGREDTMHQSSPAGRNGVETNNYSAPLRTGRTETGLNNALNKRAGSLDRRKGAGDGSSGFSRRFNSNETISKMDTENSQHDYSYTPSPTGRPPSGGSYQHKSRKGSGRSTISVQGYDAGMRSHMNGSGDDTYQPVRHSNSRRAKTGSASKFCHECGNKFCRMDAKFCCECGLRRMVL